MRRRGLTVLLIVALAFPAAAQQQSPAPQPPRRAAPPPAPPKEPARPPLPAEYEKPMLELSETLGSLAFLTTLCRPDERPNP
ncbi:MAG: TIGR02301 family protein, partial [Rhabdaerophilum sp.]